MIAELEVWHLPKAPPARLLSVGCPSPCPLAIPTPMPAPPPPPQTLHEHRCATVYRSLRRGIAPRPLLRCCALRKRLVVDGSDGHGPLCGARPVGRLPRLPTPSPLAGGQRGHQRGVPSRGLAATADGQQPAHPAASPPAAAGAHHPCQAVPFPPTIHVCALVIRD